MEWPLIILGIVALLLFVARSQRTPATDPADVYYDDDEEYEAPVPIRWNIGDYQPWPGTMETQDEWDIDADIEIVAALWNEAIDADDDQLSACLFAEYDRLCRIRG